MAEEYIRINELADLFGISTETIRKYEDKGIITSIRNEENGYRQYSSWEMCELLYARNFRSAGFSLNQTRSLMSVRNREALLTSIEEQQREVLSKLQQLKKQLLYLNQLSTDVCQIIAQGNEFRIETFPETAYYPLTKFQDMKTNKCNSEEQRKWLDALPFVSVMSYFPDDTYVTNWLGLSIPTDEKRVTGLDELMPERVFPAALCMTCILEAQKDNMEWSNQLKARVEEIWRQGYTLVGPVMYKGFFYGKVKGVYSALSKFYFPIVLL